MDSSESIHAERFFELGELIRQQASKIIDCWSERAKREQDSAEFAHRDELRNQLPVFLERVGAQLSSHGSVGEKQIDAAARNHGEERWRFGWKLNEVMRDYQLLRLTLLEYLDQQLDRALTLRETMAIGLYLDEAIEDAVVSYIACQEASLRESEMRVRGTFENAAVGIGHVSLDYCWLTANQRLCQLLGRSNDELMASEIWGSVDVDSRSNLKSELLQLAENRETHGQAEIRLIRSDAKTLWANCTVSLQQSSDGQALYYIVIVQDISKRRQLSDELRQAKAAAEEANRLKSEFVANVSHEIRTPMNAILGMTELALDEPLTPELRDYIATAHESANLLLSLVNDVLDFSRIEAGRLTLETIPFDLLDVVDETIKSFGVHAAEKGLELLADIQVGSPGASEAIGLVEGDPLRLRQVLTNLTSNAIKFTDQGEVIVRLRAQHHDAHTVTMQFSVVDTGIGISPEHRSRIFAPFTQADASTTRVFGGSGLGLAICNELVTQLGGTLDVESKVGGGSRFFFSLTLRKIPGSITPPNHESATHLLDGKRVLVVDDNSTSRRLLDELLRRGDVQVTLADSGEAAIHLLRAAAEAGTPFDIALVDALMPEMDGFSVCEAASEDPQVVGLTLLMISSADRSVFSQRANSIHVDGFLKKPVTRRRLLDAISSALGADNANAPDEVTKEASPVALNVLVVEDMSGNQKVVRAILRKRGHSVTLAKNGREAIERVMYDAFDVVLMDVQMPTVDGYQATMAIRQMDDADAASVPIIAMTAHAMRGDAERCLAAGMNAYISKPIDSKALIRLIEHWGNRAKQQTHVRATEAQTSETTMEPNNGDLNVITEGLAVSDFSAALARLDGNRDLLHEMSTFYREDMPALLQTIESASPDGDSNAVRRAAHSVKGLSAAFGADVVSALAFAIEQLAEKGRLDAIPPLFVRLKVAVQQLDAAIAASQSE
ncbi:MAG: response regulator [Planctomycetales bacterium]|nr:response regulator [Planctomycetales bacterium]